MRSAPTVFIDAAHNPAGAAALASALRTEFDFRFLVGVVSVMSDKDVDGILAALEPAFDQIVVTHNGSPRAMDVEELALRAEERFGPERVITADDVARRHRDRDRAGRGVRPRTTGSPAAASSSPARWSPRARRGRCSAGTRHDRAATDDSRRPAPDPWKSFRGVMAGTLILEAIVVLLALPVVSFSRGGLTAPVRAT